MKALFLDRDGTLIIDKVYLSDPAGVELITGTTDALRHVINFGYKLFLFTNQSGIGRGYHTLADTHRVNARMEELIGLPHPLFTATCIAPEAPGQPIIYRKPSPRFILESIATYQLDPARCLMIGDNLSDFQAALAAHIRPIAVRTGKIDPHTFPEVAQHQIPVYETFARFAKTLTE